MSMAGHRASLRSLVETSIAVDPKAMERRQIGTRYRQAHFYLCVSQHDLSCTLQSALIQKKCY